MLYNSQLLFKYTALFLPLIPFQEAYSRLGIDKLWLVVGKKV